MAYIQGVRTTDTTQAVVVADLSYPANTYAKIRIFNYDTGESVDVNSGSSTTSAEARFYGLQPSTRYRYYAETTYGTGSRRIPDSDYVGYTTDPPPPPPIVIGSVTGVTSSAVTTTSYTLSWSAATNATAYEIQNRLQGTTAWSSYNTTQTSITIPGLQPETYYEVRVRGYQGSTFGPYTSITTIKTQSLVPTPLNWPTFSTTSTQGALTAKNWNDMTAKINAWLTYKKLSTFTFTVATNGSIVTATMFNQAVTQLNRMNPPLSAPASVTSTTTGLSARLNRLGDSIDSLTA